MTSRTLILGAVLSVSLGANAQNATETNTNASTVSASTLVAPVGASTTSAAAAPALETAAQAPSVFQLKLSSENAVGMKTQRELGAGAPVTSLNALGLAYTVAPKTKIGVTQYMQYLTNYDNLDAATKASQPNAFEMSYLVLNAGRTLESGLLGSSPVFIDLRYYAPTERSLKEAKKLGLVRLDVIADWTINPAWTITGYVSPRVLLNSAGNPDAAVGTDADYYRMVFAAYPTYNFNDKINVYYGYTADVRSRDAQRGTWSVSRSIDIHEIGANFSVGKVTINPVLSSELKRGADDASVLTADSRVFSEETTSYNLNMYASF